MCLVLTAPAPIDNALDGRPSCRVGVLPGRSQHVHVPSAADLLPIMGHIDHLPADDPQAGVPPRWSLQHRTQPRRHDVLHPRSALPEWCCLWPARTEMTHSSLALLRRLLPATGAAAGAATRGRGLCGAARGGAQVVGCLVDAAASRGPPKGGWLIF